MKRVFLALGFIAAISAAPQAAAAAPAADTNWPQWRGPNGNGVSEAKGLPTTWSDTENVAWKIDVPAFAGSTPVIWGDRLFLVSPDAGETIAPPQTGEADQDMDSPSVPVQPRGGGGRGRGAATDPDAPRPGFGPGTGSPRANVPGVRIPGERVGPNPGGSLMHLWCVDKNTGAILWKKPLAEGNFQSRKGNMASPSPVTDGERVYAITGLGTLVAFDFEGAEIWRRDFQTDATRFGPNYGYASSPLLFKDRLILAVVHGAQASGPSYILALNKATGEPIWKTERPTPARGESQESYASPELLIRGEGAEIVMNGGDLVTGHDAMTGQEVWRVEGLNASGGSGNRIIPSSTIAPNGLIFAPNKEKPVLVLDGNDRDEQGRPKLLWQTNWGPDVSSPVSDGKYLWIYSKDSLGIFVCHDARTGAPLYERQRLEAGGYHTASLVLADGKIYATNENAETTVLEASPEFKVLARNKLDGAYTISSMAISDGHLFIRTGDHLFCIGANPGAPTAAASATQAETGDSGRANP